MGWAGIVGALILASFTSMVGPATAQTPPPTQQVPISTWVQPGSGNLDGLGAFVYVAPPAPGATQGSPGGYEYHLRFDLEDRSLGILVLGHKDGQRVAGFGTCAFYPRIDAFFYAPMGWRGEAITNATLLNNSTSAGACPTTTKTSDGWQWYTLGSPA